MRGRNFAREMLGRLPTLDAHFRRFVWSRVHFPEAEMRFLHEIPGRPLDVSIDVGAALGAYTWILSRKSRRVIAFEPGVNHAEFLGKALRRANIDLVQAAAGRTTSKSYLRTPGAGREAFHTATLSLHNPTSRLPNVEVTEVFEVALDDFSRSGLRSGERVDLMKIDVEGYELAVLEGSEKLLRNNLPLIICEIEARHNPHYREVFKFLRGLGYESYVWRKTGFEAFVGTDIERIQSEEHLRHQFGRRGFVPGGDGYINNFVFDHPRSIVRVPG